MNEEMLAPVRVEDLGGKRQETTLSGGIGSVLFERSGMPVYLRPLFWIDPIGKGGSPVTLNLGAGGRYTQVPDQG